VRINRSLITFLPDTGAGSGTVTSVALTAPNIFSVLGSPIVTSGTIQIGLVNQLENTFWGGPATAPEGVPTFRSLVAADIPVLDVSKITSGVFGVARGGTGASTLTGVLIGNGTSAFTSIAGTANQILRRNSANNAYEFFTPASSVFVIDYDSSVIGSRNSVNKLFTVTSNFVPGSTRVFVNGLRYSNGGGYDYVETGLSQITFTNAPDSGDLIIIEYLT
jgi:hypothetical protein